MFFSILAQKLACQLAKQHSDLTEDKIAVLVYAMEVLFLNLINLSLTLLIGYFMGYFQETLLCLVVAFFYRSTAGGAHSSSFGRCLLVTITIFPAIAYLANYLTFNPLPYVNTILAYMAILIGFAAIYNYAPSDTAKAPIISQARRKKLKNLSLLLMLILSLFILTFNFGQADIHEMIILKHCLSLTILWLSFNVSPAGYKLWALIDKLNLSKEEIT